MLSVLHQLETVRSYIDEIEQGERLLAELRAMEIWDRDFKRRGPGMKPTNCLEPCVECEGEMRSFSN